MHIYVEKKRSKNVAMKTKHTHTRSIASQMDSRKQLRSEGEATLRGEKRKQSKTKIYKERLQ